MHFRDVHHQERALSILRRALAGGRTHHAYLFEGPEGVGKEMAARALAARLLCERRGESHGTAAASVAHEQPAATAPSLFGPLEPDEPAGSGSEGRETTEAEFEACGECPACRLIARDNHPDFHLIHRDLRKYHPERSVRESKGLFLVVELIRHFLIAPSTTTPALGRARVFVIRDAERMNEGAQNALLKTLEEPPGRTHLILITTAASRLLPTIRSRCQTIPFGALPVEFVQSALEERAGVAAEPARTLAQLSGGSLGVALYWHRIGLLDAVKEVVDLLARRGFNAPESFGKQVVDQANALAGRTIVAGAEEEEPGDESPAAPGGGRAARRAKAPPKSIPTDDARTALKLVLKLLAAAYRDALTIAETDGAALCHLSGHAGALRSLAGSRPRGDLDEAIEAVAHAETMLDRNVAPQLVCERLAAALSGALPVV